MDALSEHELLEVWDLGQTLHPVDRALALLAFARPEATPDELAAISVGQRNEQLVELRTATFGSRIEVSGNCPHCGERVEVTLDAGRLVAATDSEGESPFEFESGGYRIVFRLPDSRDLALAVRCEEVAEARSLLLGRCVVETWRDGGPCPSEDLPEEAVAALGDAIAARDPLAEIRLELGCPQCGESWQREVDVAELLWHEVSVGARRLLHEVDALARAYGWTEPQVLAISSTRRRHYLEMVTA